MEILKSIGLWVLIVALAILLWKPLWRYVGRAAQNAYGKMVAIGGTLILLAALALAVYLFGSK